jgi:crotonobetainyl-CoA:carnitine CoA-transferase CaiB-like acyl-CoA transferase
LGKKGLSDNGDKRGAERDVAYPLIEEWTRTRSKWEVMELCQAAGSPSTAVMTVEEFAKHPSKSFDIARKLLRYQSNAYALVLSDEFNALRSPPRANDTLLVL